MDACSLPNLSSQVVIPCPDTVPSLGMQHDLAKDVVTHRTHRPYYYYEEPKDLEEEKTVLWKGIET